MTRLDDLRLSSQELIYLAAGALMLALQARKDRDNQTNPAMRAPPVRRLRARLPRAGREGSTDGGPYQQRAAAGAHLIGERSDRAPGRPRRSHPPIPPKPDPRPKALPARVALLYLWRALESSRWRINDNEQPG
jgi:hypothetical protein